MQRLLIVGGGGHGREIAAIVMAQNLERPAFDLVGLIDERGDAAGLITRLGFAVLASNNALAVHQGVHAIGIGDPAVRRRVEGLAGKDSSPATIVHPRASIGPTNNLGPGFVAFPSAVVTTNVTTGLHVHVNAGATVSHDCVLGDYVTLSPGCHVSGNVTLEDEVTLGVGAVVRQGITIGRGAFVGAGAVVVADVAPGVTVVGVPAKPMKAR